MKSKQIGAIIIPLIIIMATLGALAQAQADRCTYKDTESTLCPKGK